MNKDDISDMIFEALAPLAAYPSREWDVQARRISNSLSVEIVAMCCNISDDAIYSGEDENE